MALPVPAPMLASAGRPPDPPGGWSAELKWDGARGISRIQGSEVRFWSRNRRESTSAYPEVAASLLRVSADRDLLLDGELIAPDPATGAPIFGRLQRRMHVIRPTTALIAAVRVEYIVFDVLAVSGESVMDQTYLARRALLDDLELAGGLIRVPPFWNLAEIGADRLLAAASEAGMEGIISKKLDSLYEAGRRSSRWIKTPLRRTTEAVIAGWMPGNGANAATFGSLVLAAHDDKGSLRCIGCVGTGFSMSARRALRGALNELTRPTSPLDAPAPTTVEQSARWVDAVLIADIEYRELSAAGIIRHPSFRGIRTDRTITEVGWPK
ncbi:ATP-dependent DNA ligase [Nocardia altamirensis]|uniref:ATP-dependent DNA ligase n=1 Tax=Nocardia altamirensis TaxID=472158 RepID=UPI00083FFEF9|nr:RNA ligase family protein [Nocardia altamirensis]